MDRVVAFLDLLGFKNHVGENTDDALNLLRNYQAMVDDKLMDQINHRNEEPYETQGQRELATSRLIDSFIYFIPSSDSVFIIADDPNLFLRQISNFILSCFIVTYNEYRNPIDPTNPTKVEISHIKRNERGEIVLNRETSKWYPALFRGGISFGEVEVILLPSVLNKTRSLSPALAGKALVDAVMLEKRIKGPRLIFKKDFYDELEPEIQKGYVKKTELEEEGIYEILWPSFHYIKSNVFNAEIRKFQDLFIPVYNLWKAYKDEQYSMQYLNFLRLIIVSTLRHFDCKNEFKKAKDFITKELNKKDIIGEIVEYLLDSYDESGQ